MSDAPIVSISSGQLRGSSAEGIDRFLGIPDAAPPLGGRRFLPPQQVEPWNAVREPTTFGPTAPQAPYVGGIERYFGTIEIPGDDILTVNVWTPSGQSSGRDAGALLPVVVFVHGGALTRGAAALPIYDGTPFARSGVVYVSVQYRLGQEGFAIAEGIPGNLGVRDQGAALRWVRREIAAFGGDPSRVTAMGQSAGANSLATLLALPYASELFDRVIVQSGPLAAQPAKKAGRMTRAITKLLNTPLTRAGLASHSPSALVTAQTTISGQGSPLGGGPAVVIVAGDDMAPVSPIDAFLAGAAQHIPVLIGTTSEEYRAWLVPSGAVEKIRWSTVFLARLASKVPRAVVRAHGARRPDASAGEVLGEIIGDMLLRAPMTRFADSRVGADAGTWVYEFRWRSPLDRLGASHAMEFGFVFDALDLDDSRALTGDAAPQNLADAMHSAWVAFIVDGDPGWERWSAKQPVQAFDADGGHIDYAPRADELEGLPHR